jgi:hypothetical protein
VPLFQRPYVWNRDEDWTALWEDIRRVIERTERAGDSGDTVAPHFLGAVVFDKTPYLSSNLETRQVIDGQQRLTTLQLFLYAARLSAAGMDHERSVRLLSKFLENDEDLFDVGQYPDHRYKVWPTNADRDQFRAVMSGQGGAGVLAQAVGYFREEIDTWVAEAAEPADRLDALVQTMREQLRLVIIDLEDVGAGVLGVAEEEVLHQIRMLQRRATAVERLEHDLGVVVRRPALQDLLVSVRPGGVAGGTDHRAHHPQSPRCLPHLLAHHEDSP